MAKSPGGFRAALLIGWVVLGAAGLWYARLKGIPGWAAFPVLAAFLVEYPFYLVPAFPSVRERFAGAKLPLYLLAGTVLPYLVCCLGALTFQWSSLLRLAALALALGLWYVILPAHPIVDVAFLALVASVVLGKYFDAIYPKPCPGVDLKVLGGLSLNQIAVMTLLLERRIPEPGYGFVPTWEEWRIGVLHYLGFLPIGLILVVSLKATHFVTPKPIWYVIGTFVAALWAGALVEQFYFYGVLRQWIEDWTWNPTAALVITSVLFGLVHLWFRGFPNWRWVPIAAALGWFCGHARNQAGSIRAGVVTHALVITTWRAFLA